MDAPGSPADDEAAVPLPRLGVLENSTLEEVAVIPTGNATIQTSHPACVANFICANQSGYWHPSFHTGNNSMDRHRELGH